MRTILITIALSLLAVWAYLHFAAPQTASASKPETAYERVSHNGELRCGYSVFTPYLIKDANTGTLSGIWHDLTEEMAKELNLKVIWSEEVGLGDIAAALNANRFDVYCGGLWVPGARVRSMMYLDPAAFEAMLVFVRADDTRFNNDFSLINRPETRISTIDGEGGILIADADFPKATRISLPQLSSSAEMFGQITSGKADLAISSAAAANEFMATNPGKLRAITAKPLRVFPVTHAVAYGQADLREMLNRAMRNVLDNGKMETILRKYEKNPGHDFWRVTPPYTIPQ